MTQRSRLFDLLIVKSWWVILFCLSCLMLFDFASRHHQVEKQRLLTRLQEIQIRLCEEKRRQDQFKSELVSQQDPQWLEFVLMRNLGLVPEGATKVIVTPQQDKNAK